MGSFDRGNRGGGRGFGGPRRDFGPRSDRPLFKATCSNCGRECEVPFRPTNGKPVYCSDCFEKLGRGKQENGRPENSGFRAPTGENKAQLEAITTKLDKIIRLLEANIAPVVTTPQVEEKTAEPKAKKVSKKTSK